MRDDNVVEPMELWLTDITVKYSQEHTTSKNMNSSACGWLDIETSKEGGQVVCLFIMVAPKILLRLSEGRFLWYTPLKRLLLITGDLIFMTN